MRAALDRHPGIPGEMAAGRFDTLLGWLRTEVHAVGRTLESVPLVSRATGRTVSERWLLESLEERYGPAHGF
jgi:carboxypeptidase Taq